MIAIEITQIGSVFGAQVRGANLTDGLGDGDVSVIRAALMEHGVLMLSDQDVTSEQQIPFSQRFGKLLVSPQHSRTRRFLAQVLQGETSEPVQTPSSSDLWGGVLT